jgi:hypothetical protein
MNWQTIAPSKLTLNAAPQHLIPPASIVVVADRAFDELGQIAGQLAAKQATQQ